MKVCYPDFPAADAERHASALSETIRAVLHGGAFVLGPQVESFEQEFAEWLGVAHCIGVGSGTDALELILRAHSFPAGSCVVVPSFSPSAVGAAVQRAGLRLVLADIDPGTFTLSAASLLRVIETGMAVRAVIAVHLFGHPVDWQELETVCQLHEVRIIEDVAQAHGAWVHGRRAGTLAPAAAFSFYPTKNLGALGDAGAVVTNDEALAQRVRELRQYGWQTRHISGSAGVNSRLDELQAAVLRVKLLTLEDQLEARRALAQCYLEQLCDHAPPVRADCVHAWHLFVVRCADRDEALQTLQANGVPVAVHYPRALHEQPAFAAAQTMPLPESERAARTVLSLPLHPYLEPQAVSHAASCLLPLLSA